MPYSITRGEGCSPDKPWGVVKDSDGTVVACHATKESALAQIRALYAVEPQLAKARERVAKHLAGQHNQSTHGKGGGAGEIASAPAKRNKKDIAGDDQRAAELYASGKTWDQVAQEMGYANGGVARRAGKRHEERQKAKDDEGTDKPVTPKPEPTPPAPVAPAVTTPAVTTPSTPTPDPVDVTNPRPMTGTDPSQQTVPTDDINIARETGRPFKPFTTEGHSPEVTKAQDELRKRQKDYEDHYEKVFGVESRRREAIYKTEKEKYDKVEKEWEKANPKSKDEGYSEYWAKRDKALNDAGFIKPKENFSTSQLVKDGFGTQADVDFLDVQSKAIQRQWETTRKVVQVDTAQHLLGVQLTRDVQMVPDLSQPINADGTRPKKVDMTSDYENPNPDGTYPQIPRVKEVYILPDGNRLEHYSLFDRSDGSHLTPEMMTIRETARFRMRKVEQINTRQQAIDRDGDGKFNEAMKTTLRHNQAIVDSPNTRIVIHAPTSAVGGIVSSGFKSQHETGRSKGFKGKETRAGFEAASIGVVSGDDKSKMPIYGALHTGGVQDRYAIGTEQYGEVGFVLKRETHQRATFTETDSLGICYEASSLTGVQTRFNGGQGNGGVHRTRDGLPDFDESLTTRPKRSEGYREAQVLGGVKMSDVDYVVVPKGTKLPEASRKKLVKAGIPIVEYDLADVAPPVRADRNIEDYGSGAFPDDGLWTPLPSPTAKRIGVVVDIFKHLAGQHDQRSHSGKSSSHGGYQLNEPKNPQPKAGQYRADSVDAARAERARISEIEPAMTREMIDIANTHGATMEGLDYRMKSDESLARKVDAEKDADFGGDATKTAQSMSDVVRYTMTYPDDQYAANVDSTLRDMEARGYKARVKNYWEKDDPYQGINVALTHPSGVKVELQFHTPKSVKVKETVHGLLDKFRAEPNPRTKFGLWDRMVRVSNQIPVPPPPEQLMSIGDIKRQTFALKMRTMLKQMMEEIDRGV